MKRLALWRALSDKATDGTLAVADVLSVDGPKTGALDRLLKKIFGDGQILFVDEKFDVDFILASRNIGRIFTVDSHSLNAFDVVRHKNVILGSGAVGTLVARLNGGGRSGEDE
jgi:ribosomal protein L4